MAVAGGGPEPSPVQAPYRGMYIYCILYIGAYVLVDSKCIVT